MDDARWSRVLHAIVFAGIVLATVCCALDGARTLHPDPFAYGSAAGEVLDGKQLYGEVWQDKPPLGLLAYAAPQLVARGSALALGVFLGIVLALQAVLVLRAFGREHRVAATAAALVLVLYPASRWDFAWLSTDHVSNIGTITLLVCAWQIHRDRTWTRNRLVLAGVAAAACFLVRQTSVVFVVAPIMAIACSPATRRARLLAVLALGGISLAAVAVLIALCLPVIDLRAGLYTVFVYPMRYAGETMPMSGLVSHEFVSLKTAYAPIVLFLIAIASDRWRIVCVAAACSIAAAMLPHKPYYHYLEALVPLLALVVFVACEMKSRAPRVLAWCFVGWLVAFDAVRAIAMAREPIGPHHRELDEVAAAVRELAGPGDTVGFAIASGDAAYLTFATHVPTTSAVSLAYQVDGYVGGILPVPRDEIYDGFRAHPPSIIVIEPDERAPIRILPIELTAIAHRPPYHLARTLGAYQIYTR